MQAGLKLVKLELNEVWMLCYEYIEDSFLSRESNRDPLPCRLPFQLSHPSDSNTSENYSHTVLKNNRKVNSLNLRPIY